MIRILSIGNSFSQDAQRYLYKIAKNENTELKCVNLFIGGCSLKRHYLNMLENNASYDFEFKGESTGIKVSMKQALMSDEWDYVTLQQVSHLSPDIESYTPYIEKLAEYVRIYAPKTKILLHQTWAYEQGSQRLAGLGFADQHDMLAKNISAYACAAKEISAAGIIPSGEALMRAIDLGVGKIHRDGFHADLGIGRYLLGLIWYKSLTGLNVVNEFKEFDVEVDPSKVELVKKVAAEFLLGAGS